MDENKQSEETQLYHERQVKELCALHALNNLFQKKQTFTKKELDEICNRLSPDSFINPHRSMLGMGNYDVNVLMAALQEKGYETVWFDKRKDVDVLVMENIMGLILNTPTEYKLGFIKLPIHRKHWIAIRCLHGQYMNLDSKLDSPKSIGDEDSLMCFLRSELSDGDKELLLVVEPRVSEKSLWKKQSIDCSSNHVVATESLTANPDNDVDTSEKADRSTDKDSLGDVQNGMENIDLCNAQEEKGNLDGNIIKQEPTQCLNHVQNMKDKETVGREENQIKL